MKAEEKKPTFKLEGTDLDYIETEVVRSLEKECRSYLKKNPKKGNVVIFSEKHAFSVAQVLALSKQLTSKFEMPVVVLPAAKKAPHMEEASAPMSSRYVTFKCKITGDVQQYKNMFELFRAFKFTVEEETRYAIYFISEKTPTRKSFYYDEFRSIRLERFSYLAIAGHRKFILLSDKPLRIGHEYEVTGLCFTVRDLQNMKIHLGKRQAVCLSMHVKDEDEILRTDWETVEKCKGKSFEWFVKSVTYPFDNCLAEFAELMTTSTFHLTTGFLFNILLIGGPNRGKTAFLSKMASIFGDEVIETGASTMKGLIPSFYHNNIDAGVLANAQHRALINEFFELLSKVDPRERPSFLNQLKSVLEGRETFFTSGLGSMRTRMRADLMAGSNFPRKKGGSFYHSVLELYEDWDGALLDRILFYTVPSQQESLVVEYKDYVRNLLRMTGGTDEIEQLKLLKSPPELLNRREIKNLAVLGKKMIVKVGNTELQKKLGMRMMKTLPAEKCTRHQEFLLNIASAYAYMRCLLGGLVTPHTRIIQVEDEDLEKAYHFLLTIYHTYEEHDVVAASKRMSAIMALTSCEKTLFGILYERYKQKKESVHLRKIDIKELFAMAGTAYTQNELSTAMTRLANKELAINSGKYVMYMPELSVEAAKALTAIRQGNEVEQMFAIHLMKLGLVIYDQSRRKYEDNWRSGGSGTVNLINAGGE